ncbi:MAG: tRNA (5-methylaminomethyl-2-thiouridine)(34)-methyltransferase MnmD [Bacteroidetes bacterium]|nr:tRNA (5-methylaminomethyl-2-thiouridine)(34)-methyltransferase MnmD [Bacteroidota bacterium]
MLKSTIIKTNDGSDSLYVPELDEHYHSVYGAVQEAMHVYINNGFNFSDISPISILEIGFGTGLNAFLTYLESKKTNRIVKYTSVELYPVASDIVEQLNYPEFINNEEKEFFYNLHKADWNCENRINDSFILNKINQDLLLYQPNEYFDLIYFDAFAPDKQPELWSVEVFRKLYNHLNENGILTTYSAKGIVKRALREVGFKVKRLPGPPGKWEMLRSQKV